MIRPVGIRVRAGTLSTGHKSYFIALPWQIAEAVPKGMEFLAEFTDEGILLRPVGETPKVDPPAWAKEAA